MNRPIWLKLLFRRSYLLYFLYYWRLWLVCYLNKNSELILVYRQSSRICVVSKVRKYRKLKIPCVVSGRNRGSNKSLFISRFVHRNFINLGQIAGNGRYSW